MTLICGDVWPVSESPPPEYNSRSVHRNSRYATPASSPGQERTAPSTKAEPGLYLKLAALNCSEMERVNKLLRIFSGSVTVCVRLADSGKLMRHPLRAGNVNYLADQLKALLGEQNVAIVGEVSNR